MAFAEQFIYLFPRHLMVSPSGLVPESIPEAIVVGRAAQSNGSQHTAADHVNERFLVTQVAELNSDAEPHSKESPLQRRAIEETERRGAPRKRGIRGHEDNWRTDRISGRASHHACVARRAGVSESDPVGYVRA